MKQANEIKSTASLSTQPTTQNIAAPEDYFFDEELGFKGYSVIIFNENGIVIGANRKNHLNNTSDFEKEQFLVPIGKDLISTDCSERYTHAYVVVNAQWEFKPNEFEKVQILIMRGVRIDHGKVVSEHDSLWRTARAALKSFFKKHHIELANDLLFSGECKSALLVKDMKNILGMLLTGFIINTKGTKTNYFKTPIFKGSKVDPEVDLPPPVLTSYIPEENMKRSNEFDQQLQLDSPEERLKYLKTFIKTLLDHSFFSPPGPGVLNQAISNEFKIRNNEEEDDKKDAITSLY
ncbi:hypothetical protein [Legionella gresilensis]|uniref:hypothetical protein n=1 Tax=Legionella gresilensis TaxID=91823 RepID=UPI001040FB53|nr:hypothetical protein [Legionella gresilensis]